MPYFIASYDLRASVSPHTTFTKHAQTNKWSTKIPTADGEAHLPNTTLYGVFDSIDAAVTALEQARAATQVEMKIAVHMPRYHVAPIGDGRIKDKPSEGLGGLSGIGIPKMR